MSRRARAALILLACLGGGTATAGAQTSPQTGRLFPPTDLGLLEVPDRAVWQRPDQVMDALKVADGSRVADIGAGAVWFTVRLARRVGPNGLVYAQDIQALMIQAINRRITSEGLSNVETRRATTSDPNLPLGALDAVLVSDAYQEVEEDQRVDFLRNLAATLKPNGRLGIVNYKPGRGGPGPDSQRRVPMAALEEDARAAGLRVLDRVNLPFQYMVVLSKSPAP